MGNESTRSADPVPEAASSWRREPFRLFFPLGIVLAWAGIGHWLLYRLGVKATYSCLSHGMIQMQAFLVAFAMGFLFTALPRRTQSAPPSAVEIGLVVGALLATTVAAVAEVWWAAELAYAVPFLVLLQFAVRRFLGGGAGRRPPAAFVLIPIGVAQGLGGAGLIAAGSLSDSASAAWMLGLGRLFVEQGVFLSFAVGVGNLVLPLMAGTPPPADLGSSPRERRKVIGFAAAGLLLVASFVLEQAEWARLGPLLRAAVIGTALVGGAGAWKAPGKSGLHRRLVWFSAWMLPVGLSVSAIFPDYRVPALHIVFIGGFGLMAFGVATHVALSHLPGMEPLALGRPRPVMVTGAAFLLALAARLAADFSHTYFDHLAWASALWIAGSVVWLVFLGPRLLRRDG